MIDEEAKRIIKRAAYWIGFIYLLICDIFMMLDMLGK